MMDLVSFYFPLLLFYFFSFLYLIFDFILLFFILDLDKRCNVMVTQVTKHDRDMISVTVTVTKSCDIKKDIKDSGTNNVI